MNGSQQNQFMQEEDLLYTILADLKRTSREYTTGVTEAACPVVRQMFTDLTHSTLTMQGQLFTLMEKNNMYSVASPALRQELDKQLKDNQQLQMKSNQFVQQKLGQTGYGHYQQHAHQQQEHHQGNYNQYM
ncbi:coat protein F [Paenibacillus sp. KS1]|uniref:spore coat protein n=1 Tax=Paenibacillus sp. KS1 TaxID=1849249 RepID=UPI00080653EE|nr:spore coat protein [Paenibacillus sp. KS1]OBY78821.1 coat protein F [Paenibacillus sp. KS1]